MLHGKSGDLWAKAVELERQYEGYKQRLKDRRAAAMAVANGHSDGGVEEVVEEVGRGRRYEAYMTRRDERLRQGWRARMERKEAEMKVLWARLDRHGCAAAGEPARELKLENVEGRRSSDVTPRCMSGAKKQSITRSFPSPVASPRPSNHGARRRAPFFQELPPPNIPRKESRTPLPSSTAATTPRTRTLSRSKSSQKEHITVRTPRSKAPRTSSADLKRLVMVPNANAILMVDSCLNDPEFLNSDTSETTSVPLVLADFCGNVEISSHLDGEAKRFDIEKYDGEEVTGCSAVDVTGDSDTEPSYVYVKKDGEEETVGFSESLGGSVLDAEPNSKEKDEDNVEENAVLSDNVVEETAVVDAEVVSGASSESLYSNVQSSFSDKSEFDTSALNSPLRSPHSCFTLSIEQLLEANTAKLREKREENTENIRIPRTPTRRISIAMESPKDAVTGLKKFLSFGKKNKVSEVRVIDHVPPSPSSSAEGESMTGEFLSVSANLIKPRMGSSVSASDDLDQSFVSSLNARALPNNVPASPAKSELKEIDPPAKSPKVHRSFFSFPSLKCRANLYRT